MISKAIPTANRGAAEIATEAKIISLIPKSNEAFVSSYTNTALYLWSNELNAVAFKPETICAAHELCANLPSQFTRVLTVQYLSALKQIGGERVKGLGNDVAEALTSKPVIEVITTNYLKEYLIKLGREGHMGYMLGAAYGATLGSKRTEIEPRKVNIKSVKDYLDITMSPMPSFASLKSDPRLKGAAEELYYSLPYYSYSIGVSQYIIAAKVLEQEKEVVALEALTSKEAIDVIKYNYSRLGLSGNASLFIGFLYGVAHGAASVGPQPIADMRKRSDPEA
jgi:hypothetical protein